jgi:hypothetical protein
MATTKRLRLSRLIATVSQDNLPALLHGMNHLFQIHAFRWDVFKHYSVLQAHTLTNEIVHREGRKHPVLHGILTQDFFVTDIIAITVSPVAIDVDAEKILNGIFMTIEGGTAEGNAFAHLRPQPFLVDFRKGDSLRSVDGIHQPDVFLE